MNTYRIVTCSTPNCDTELAMAEPFDGSAVECAAHDHEQLNLSFSEPVTEVAEFDYDEMLAYYETLADQQADADHDDAEADYHFDVAASVLSDLNIPVNAEYLRLAIAEGMANIEQEEVSSSDVYAPFPEFWLD